MSQDVMIGVSGIRGIVGGGLTPELAAGFAAALGTHAQGGRIVVSSDGRPSGAMLRHAVLSGLLSTGCSVKDLDVASTPTCGLAVRRLKAAAGMQITASHNPAAWNGLKLLGPDGRVLSANDGQIVRDILDRQQFRRVSWTELGQTGPCLDAADWHCEQVLRQIDEPRVRAAGLRVFLDANGGAGGPLGCTLLEALRCQVTRRGCAADGLFLHEPEPTSANLRDVAPLVVEARADLGCVLDPDADRLALIDEAGRYIGEELTLALACRFRLRQQPGTVVVNMSTSRAVEDIARQHGSRCVRSAVGEANVADKMIEVDAVLGGEGNGGVIDPRVGFVRDPFIGMALILSLMAETGKRLGELVAELPVYAMVKEKYTVERSRLPELWQRLKKRWPDARVDELDGLRLDWPDRWLHVRPSNTEPIIRAIAEAPRIEEAQALCRDAEEILH